MRKAVFIAAAVVVIGLVAFLLCRKEWRKEGEGPPVPAAEKEVDLLEGRPALSDDDGPGERVLSSADVAQLARSGEEDGAAAVAGFIGGLQPAEARWEAARAAAAEGTPAMAESLVRLFHDGEPRARIMAAYAMKGIYDRTGDPGLGRSLQEEAVPLLSEMAGTYLDPQIKRDSWSTLGYIDPDRALRLYREQGKIPYAVEERAILAIGENGGESAAADAIAMFDEASTDGKKVSACRILGLLGARQRDGASGKFMEERGLAFLKKSAAAGGGDPLVRRAAVTALGESGDGECLQLLQEAAREHPREAARAMEKIRSRGGRQ